MSTKPIALERRPIASFSRRYHFSASHRLHSESYDAQRNREVFGKCNNPYGHGHNYVVQVTFRGAVDVATGMVCNLGDLDAFAQTNLLARFDHTNLNTLDCFATRVSTTENLAIEVHKIFEAFPLARLDSVHVEETSNNSFDYAGESLTPLDAARLKSKRGSLHWQPHLTPSKK